MPFASRPIFALGSDNKTVRYWHYEVDGAQWRGHHGVVGGKDAVSGWSATEPKNVGKKNARTAEEQAQFEADAEEKKKLDREYRRTHEELADVPMSVMLAQDYTKQKKPLIFNPRSVWSQPKLDGIRLTASARGGFSREYQPFHTVDHILEALAPLFADIPDLKLDGELYNHSLKHDFNKISSLVRKKTLTTDERFEVQRVLEYHVYDVPSVEGGFAERHEYVNNIFCTGMFDLEPVVMVPTAMISGLSELDDCYADYLAKGYEGQMVRLDEAYEFGVRAKSLQKRKTFVTEEFEVSRIIEGNGNWAGCAKAVEFKMANGVLTEKGELPKAGIRGTEAAGRELLTRNPPPKIVTVRHLGLTPGGVPRGPVAIDFDRAD